MRNYRHKEYPKTVHGWPPDAEEPVSLVVRNKIEEERAVAAGWSVEPLHGPAGRLDALEIDAPEEVEEKPREFAAPGKQQPFENGTEAKTVKTAAAAGAGAAAKKPKATTKGRSAQKAKN